MTIDEAIAKYKEIIQMQTARHIVIYLVISACRKVNSLWSGWKS